MKKVKKNFARERILSVAEELFAEKGYYGVGVREIASKAKVNIAAINYYFGSKKGLYLEVFEKIFIPRTQEIRQKFRESIKRDQLSLENVVKSLVEAVFSSFPTEKERNVHFSLFIRALTQHSEATELIVEKGLKPLIKEVVGTLKNFVHLSETELYLSVFSIIGQIIQFQFLGHFVKETLKKDNKTGFTEDLISHIVKFSLKGLEGVK